MAKILLVDDSSTMRKLWSAPLEQAGNDVVQAADGAEALSQLLNDDFDIVLTDVNMPKMDGLTLVRALRQVEKLKDLPVLLIAVDPGEKARNQALSQGATGWILKPIQPDKLVTEVGRALRRANGPSYKEAAG